MFHIEKLKNLPPEKIRIFKNTFALVIVQICCYVLPFITLPYLSRVLEVDKFGLVFFAQAMMDYFNRFVKFGFEFSGVRQIAVNRDDKDKVNTIFNSIFIIQLCMLALCFIIIAVVILIVPKFRTDWIVYVFTAIGIIGNILTFTWFYQGMERMKFITFINVTIKLVSLILIFTFVKKAGDYYLVPLLYSLGTIFAGLLSLIFIKKEFKIKFFVPKIKTITEEFKYSSQFFITKISIAIYRQANAFVLGLVVSNTAVAYYVAADKIFYAVIALYNTFNNALFPFMSKNKDIAFFKKIQKYLVITSLGFSLFLFLMSKPLIMIFFTKKMIDAVVILKIFAISYIFYTFAETLGFPLLGACGYVKETNNGYILGGICNLIALVLLYVFNCLNIYTVAIAVSATYIIMFLHRYYYIYKYKILNKK